MSESSEKALDQYPTDRPLHLEDSGIPRGMQNAVLDRVGLSVEDLKNKKILDVGIGGGGALSQARKLGLNYYGADLLPVKEPEYAIYDNQKRREEMKRALLRRAALNPSRIVAADAHVALPFPADSFDVVLASKSSLLYAKNADQVKRTILEMIRVSRDLVATSESFDDEGNFVFGGIKFAEGLFPGSEKEIFNLKEFLEDLRMCGIIYQRGWDDPKNAELIKEGSWKGPWTQYLHIDTTKKNNALFYEKARELLDDPNYPPVIK